MLQTTGWQPGWQGHWLRNMLEGKVIDWGMVESAFDMLGGNLAPESKGVGWPGVDGSCPLGGRRKNRAEGRGSFVWGPCQGPQQLPSMQSPARLDTRRSRAGAGLGCPLCNAHQFGIPRRIQNWGFAVRDITMSVRPQEQELPSGGRSHFLKCRKLGEEPHTATCACLPSSGLSLGSSSVKRIKARQGIIPGW